MATAPRGDAYPLSSRAELMRCDPAWTGSTDLAFGVGCTLHLRSVFDVAEATRLNAPPGGTQ